MSTSPKIVQEDLDARYICTKIRKKLDALGMKSFPILGTGSWCTRLSASKLRFVEEVFFLHGCDFKLLPSDDKAILETSTFGGLKPNFFQAFGETPCAMYMGSGKAAFYNCSNGKPTPDEENKVLYRELFKYGEPTDDALFAVLREIMEGINKSLQKKLMTCGE